MNTYTIPVKTTINRSVIANAAATIVKTLDKALHYHKRLKVGWKKAWDNVKSKVATVAATITPTPVVKYADVPAHLLIEVPNIKCNYSIRMFQRILISEWDGTMDKYDRIVLNGELIELKDGGVAYSLIRLKFDRANIIKELAVMLHYREKKAKGDHSLDADALEVLSLFK